MTSNAIPDVGATPGNGAPGNTGTFSDYYIKTTPVNLRINAYLAKAQANGGDNTNDWTNYLTAQEKADLDKYLGAQSQTAGTAGTPGTSSSLPTSAAASATSSAPADPDSILANLTAQYGGLGALLQIPGLHDLAQEAAASAGSGAPWSAAQLQTKLQATPWWQQTPSTSRSWQVTLATDPAEAKRLLVQQTDTLRASASKLGQPIDESKIMWLGLDALQNGWNADQASQHLADIVLPTEGDASTLQGEAGATSQKLQATAGQYATPISNQALYSWSRGIMDGSQTEDGFNTYVQDQAKSMYPGLASAIDSGVTVKQYADPYVQQAAKTLEIAPESIDLTDPKWNRFLNQVDPKTGGRTSMSIADATATMMTDPTYGYDQTQQAKTQASDFVTKIGQQFGALG